MSVKPRSFLKVFFIKGGILFYLVAIVLFFIIYNFWYIICSDSELYQLLVKYRKLTYTKDHIQHKYIKQISTGPLNSPHPPNSSKSQTLGVQI